MRLRFAFRFLGGDIAFDYDTDPGVEYEYEEEAAEEETPGIGGGSSMCFERDADPLSAVGEEPWPWDTDRGFGFQA